MIDYTFVDCPISKDNIGEHDGNNRFISVNMENKDELIQNEIDRIANEYGNAEVDCFRVGLSWAEFNENKKNELKKYLIEFWNISFETVEKFIKMGRDVKL